MTAGDVRQLFRGRPSVHGLPADEREQIVRVVTCRVLFERSRFREKHFLQATERQRRAAPAAQGSGDRTAKA